ncbi:unnamed protein product [Candidula unifasciata]|uniref:Uncharacterized protein n=1 Tax=Candidula unifasciata TaxID=100452 RepID=A0A8S3ZFW7_9EUPU|nr:unnamed protein product [Candidula unifasciata]
MSSTRTGKSKGEIDVQAKFESMRGFSSNAQILRRHHDLKREGEKELRAIEMETRLEAMKICRLHAEYSKKLKQLEKIEANTRMQGKGNVGSQNQRNLPVTRPKQKDKKEVLLFRIEKRNGRDIYIKEAPKKRPDVNDIFLF